MEGQRQIPGVPNNDEISLKDLIIKLNDWFRYLLGKWLVIAIAILLGGVAGVFYAFTQSTKYVAELTFILEEGKSSPLSSYTGLASQFGVDLGGSSGGNGLFAGDNIIEYLSSRLIIEKALLSAVDVNGKPQSLAELYIDFNKMREKWVKDSSLRNVHFLPNADRKLFNRTQDSILNSFYLVLRKQALLIERPDKKSGFITVTCVTPNEVFSKSFTEHLVDEATKFYVGIKTKRSQSSVDKLQAKADSIESLLNRKTFSAAVAEDLNLNPVRKIATVSSEVASRDKVVLQTMYAEVVKNLELSRISMAQETPVIQVIDAPLYPLAKDKLGKMKGGFMGGVFCGFLVVMFLTIGRIRHMIMK